jgi:hypothetical protein
MGTPGISPVICGDDTYYELTCCSGNTRMTGDMVFSQALGDTFNYTQSQRTDYKVNIAGIEIPIFKTTRDWSVVLDLAIGQPIGSLRGVYTPEGFIPRFCAGVDLDIYKTAVTENCQIEASTLHYVDQRYGVCLYRYVKEILQFTKSVTDNPSVSGDLSKSCATFQGPYGEEIYWKVAIDSADAMAQCVEEWRLIINGVQSVLSTINYTKNVLSGQIISTVDCGGVDAVGEILIFPAPGMFSNPVDCDVKDFGWYKNGIQPGQVNYFYPDWCKALQVDPVWAAAEQSRLGVVFDHNPLSTSSSYTPPPITVDPIPKGSYAKHPVIGEVYQWLTTDRDGVNKVTSSPDLIALLDSKLPEGLKTHDTTLIYPISLV